MNNPNEPLLERVLRDAPKPTPPGGLKQQLIAHTRADSKLPAGHRTDRTNGVSLNQHWLRRWWPTLLPAGLSLFCVVVLAVQQLEIRDLRKAMEQLSSTVAATEAVSQPSLPQNVGAPSAGPGDATELQQLRETARQLSDEVTRLERIREGNTALRAELAKPPEGAFTAEEIAGVESARDSALRIHCINNMKQLALAALVWASDNENVFPTDVISMAKGIPSPKLLVCPADTTRQPAPDWAGFSMANCSYQWYLTPRSPEVEPNRVLTTCAIHQSAGLYDGSVHGGITPDRLVNRDGKLYMEPSAQVRTDNPVSE